MMREERSCYQDIHRHSAGTRHQRDYKHRDKTALLTLNGPGSHYGRNITAEAHHHRYEGLSVKTYLMHHSVHDECRSGHISGILQKGYEHIQQHDVRKEYKDASHSSYDTVDYKVLKPAFCHE